MLRLARHTEKIGQVEKSDADRIHSGHGSDLFYVGYADLRLDLQHHQAPFVQCLQFLARIAARVIVVCGTEHGAAPPARRILAPTHEVACLVCSLHHRHHYAVRARIEGPRHEVVLIRRNAHDRCDPEAAAAGDLLLHDVDAGARVLHVEKDELSAGCFRNLCETGCEEFEGEEPEGV